MNYVDWTIHGRASSTVAYVAKLDLNADGLNPVLSSEFPFITGHSEHQEANFSNILKAMNIHYCRNINPSIFTLTGDLVDRMDFDQNANPQKESVYSASI